MAEEAPANAIRLDPAVDSAKRIVAALNDGSLKLNKDVNNDVITMAVVILRLAGYQVGDQG